MKFAQALVLALGLFLLASCAERQENAGQRARVEAVSSSKPDTSVKDWCDVHKTVENAPLLSLPPNVPVKSGAVRPVQGATRWVWLNLWATWCKPCVREIPLVLNFSEKLRENGVRIDNWFLTIDEDLNFLADYLRNHPEVGGENSLRALDPDVVQQWMTGLGLPKDTTIPINMLVGPGGKIRCIHTGSINEGDFARIQSVLKQL